MPNENDGAIIYAFQKMPHWQKLEYLKNCVDEVGDLAHALEVRVRRIKVMARMLVEEEETK